MSPSSGEDLLLVSCDIVGSSAEPDLAVQLRRAQALNDLVRPVLGAGGPDRASWFSGGDGGHVAFAGASAPARALQMLLTLKRWSIESRIPLRIAGCAGIGERFTGADGRLDMVGPGINLSARLLQHAGSDLRIVVTEEFRTRCDGVAAPAVSFHEPRVLRGPFPTPQKVWLVSDPEHDASQWTAPFGLAPDAEQDDRADLRRAIGHADGLAVLYRAKRLLQLNNSDAGAFAALRDSVGPASGRIGSSRVLRQLLADPDLGQEFVRASVLVERQRGELLCSAGDGGRTMFLMIRGRLAGFLAGSAAAAGMRPPDFEVGPGELVGEMAFALNTKRAATLLCTEDCSFLAFNQQELLVAANASPLLPKIKDVINAIVRTRIIENLCRTTAFLSGPDRKGPLGDVDRPWRELDPFCRTMSVPWQEGTLHFDGARFSEPGLYLLAAGMLETPDGSVLQAGPPEPPILVADFGGRVHHRLPPHRLLDDATLLFIAAPGLERFGPAVHRRLWDEVHRRATGPARYVVGGTAVEGLLRVGGPASSTADVIFVHGLDGDARTTWHPKDAPTAFWPAWLAEDVPGVAVWSLGYAVSSSAWKGTSMPLVDRATNALATLETQGIGNKPTIFVCHSLGGLLVKQMLRHALDYGMPAWRAIAEQTRGIAFLSTPHSGSDISSWMKHIGALLRLTVSADELQAHDPRLRDLSTWFRNCPLVPNMAIHAYCEKQRVAGLLVVDESSADPGLPKVALIPLDENHVSICKPETREKLVYSRTRKLLAELAAEAR